MDMDIVINSYDKYFKTFPAWLLIALHRLALKFLQIQMFECSLISVIPDGGIREGDLSSLLTSKFKKVGP